MNEQERIQAKIEEQKSLVATIEANMGQIPNENRNSQMLMLQLIKDQLTNFEQAAANY